MAGKPAVLVDLNILLDVLQKREPFYNASAQVLALIETRLVTGYIASHSLPTLFYLIRKERGVSEARAVLTNVLQILKVAPVDQTTIEQALNLDYPDFEDAVQMMAAVQQKVEAVITRNGQDFKPALLPVIQPVDFLASRNLK
ncbi:MAG: PIN domain-containing protein [Anaerolineaceae bacterium]|nr:PIN domain-containing protein [Anaerolineaceae bacterium]